MDRSVFCFRNFHFCFYVQVILHACLFESCAGVKKGSSGSGADAGPGSTALQTDGSGITSLRFLPRQEKNKTLASATIVLLHLVPQNPSHSETCVRVNGTTQLSKKNELPRQKNMQNFRETLPRLHSEFLTTYNYPVTLFHSDFDGVKDDIAEIQSLLPGAKVEAEPLDVFSKERFYSPEHYEDYSDTCALLRAKPESCAGRNFAYKQMNYVFTYGMFFDTQVLHKYRYWLRLDSDSSVTHVREDPFQAMSEHQLTFAYREQEFEGGGCTDEMPSKIRGFMDEHGVKPVEPAFLQKYMEKLTYFYGNAGAGDLQFFTSPTYKGFIEYMLKEGGIWKYRWDDQHIYAQAMAMFRRQSNVGPLAVSVSHKHDRG